ncbi:MAG TPA: zinc-ribbon domain-containing protein, partial [Nitrososphaeraceae archaeon]|nr:zinc-ribbon domain-containing protein [Nitrososphaeraceae archaeon]
VANSNQPGNTPAASSLNTATPSSPSPSITKATTLTGKVGFVPIQSLVGMPAYNSEAILVGRVKEIGLRKSSEGIVQIGIRIEREFGDNNDNNNSVEDEVLWNNISKIGDIVLLSEKAKLGRSDDISSSTKETVNCPSCGYQNQENASFCEECGKKLV